MALRLVLSLSLFFSSTSWSKTQSISASEQKKIEVGLKAATELGEWVQRPSPKKFRQVFEMVKPFLDPDAYAIISKKAQREMGKAFPKFSYRAGKDKSEIKFFEGKNSQSMFILHNDPVNVYEINGTKISFEEMLTTIRWIDSIEDALSKDPNAKQSLLMNLLLPEAHAFFGNMASLLGPLLIGGGILGAGYFVGKGIGNIGSKIPTSYTINHQVPTNYSVNLPTTYNLNANGTFNGNVTGLPNSINIPIGLSGASSAFPGVPSNFYPATTGMRPATTGGTGTQR